MTDTSPTINWNDPDNWRPRLELGCNPGPDVKALEAFLLEEGINPGNVDGSFDELLHAAIRRFQKASNLKDDGIVGRMTRAVIATTRPRPDPSIRVGFIDDKLTPLSGGEAAVAFRLAFEKLTGEAPSVLTLACLLAQSALETGHWKSLHCFNFGNVKAGRSWRGLKTMFRCNEVIGGKLVWFDPPHVQTHFRAFTSPADGALDVLRFLAVDSDGDGFNRYAASWAAALRGDPKAFAEELGKAGYYTASRALYVRGLTQLFNRYTKVAIEALDARPPGLHERCPLSDDDMIAAFGNELDKLESV